MVFFLALARTLLIGIYRRVNVLGHEYVPIGIFALIALSFPILTFFAGRFFRPNNDNALKNSTYECGEVPVGEAHIQFHFQYYMFAILFVVFDLVDLFWFDSYGLLDFLWLESVSLVEMFLNNCFSRFC